MIGKHVKVISGPFINEIGKIIDEYNGIMHAEYTIEVDKDNSIIQAHHDEIEEIEEG